MGARLVYHKKSIYDNESIVEIKIWEIPKSERFPNGYKYSLVYVKEGKRVIGYDNAEGKGDHRHFYGHVAPYDFTSLEKLFAEFIDTILKV